MKGNSKELVTYHVNNIRNDRIIDGKNINALRMSAYPAAEEGEEGYKKRKQKSV